MTSKQLTTEQLAAILNVSVYTIRRMIRDGRISPRLVASIGRPGKRGCEYRIDPAAIVELRLGASQEHQEAIAYLKSKGLD